jgi:hypothetical protein
MTGLPHRKLTTPPLTGKTSTSRDSLSAAGESQADDTVRHLPYGWWLIPMSLLGAALWFLVFKLAQGVFS